VEVKLPGVMAMLVAPVAFQLRVLLEPRGMVAGEAVKVLITGATPPTTVRVAVAVVEPAALVAVRV
jgi:hypothetical protein